MSGSKMKTFSADDPIRLLAHNLDFWVPRSPPLSKIG